MKKTLYLILGAIVAFGLLFLLWSWLFSGGKSGFQTLGQFGTSTNTTQNAGEGGASGNGQSNLLGQNSANGTIPLGSNEAGGTNAGTSGGANGASSNSIGNGTTGTGSTGNPSLQNNGTVGNGSLGNGNTSQATLGSGNTSGGTLGSGTLGGGALGSSTLGGGGSIESGNVQINSSSTVFTLVTPSVPGVQWLSPTTGAGGTLNDKGNGYNPIAINGLDGASIGGTVPTLITNPTNSSNNSNSSLSVLLASGLIGVASCALQASGQTIGSLVGAGAASVGASAAVGALAVPTNDVVTHGFQGAQAANTVTKNAITFQGCLTNVLAKVALQQITASVVNWINSGFNGSPSFVTNYQQFFTNVADLAAGQFIQGAGLSFLCSPFKLQIKIAVAQSYANRGGQGQSCSLTGVVKNINSFMNGNFAQGGWPGFLSYTTIPTNNPYGAYAYAQVGLVNAQNTALANAKNNISPTGFLNTISFGQAQSCNNVTTITGNAGVSTTPIPTAGQNSQAARVSCPPGCSCSVATPGSVVEASLDKALGSGVDQLGLANDLDQIINALMTQLITKTLQGGLANLSGTDGVQSSYQTPDQIAAQGQAQVILTSLQTQSTFAQQYGSILQGSIGDIENTQSTLTQVIDCWKSAASTTGPSATAAQEATAAANVLSNKAIYKGLSDKIDALNTSITSVNTETATLQNLQTEALSIASPADVTTLSNNYSTDQSTQPFIAAADVNTEQQNRNTLQSSLASTNTAAQSSLTACNTMITLENAPTTTQAQINTTSN